jgi:hypothetical protein
MDRQWLIHIFAFLPASARRAGVALRGFGTSRTLGGLGSICRSPPRAEDSSGLRKPSLSRPARAGLTTPFRMDAWVSFRSTAGMMVRSV